jgi:hypothetical protein
MMQLAIDFTAQTTRLHRGNKYSRAAAQKASIKAGGYAHIVLKAVYESVNGLTYQEAIEHTGHEQKNIQPRFSQLSTNGEIAPLELDGKPVSRNGCGVFVITRSGYELLKELA